MRRLGRLTLSVLVATGIACTTNEGAGQVADETENRAAALAATPWRPTSIGADRLPADVGISVSFSSDGKVTGFGGCNQFFGAYELSGDGLQIGPLGASRKYCMEPVMSRETAFLEALQQARRLAVDEGSMQLIGEDGAMLVELVAVSGDPNP